MDKNEYDDFQRFPKNKLISIGRLGEREERTLLYGYTCDRKSWHVYIKNGQIHLTVALGDKILSHSGRHAWRATDLVPDKRAYPESTDHVFALLMKDAGVEITFTAFSENRYRLVHDFQYHGEVCPCNLTRGNH